MEGLELSWHNPHGAEFSMLTGFGRNTHRPSTNIAGQRDLRECTREGSSERFALRTLSQSGLLQILATIEKKCEPLALGWLYGGGVLRRKV